MNFPIFTSSLAMKALLQPSPTTTTIPPIKSESYKQDENYKPHKKCKETRWENREQSRCMFCRNIVDQDRYREQSVKGCGVCGDKD